MTLQAALSNTLLGEGVVWRNMNDNSVHTQGGLSRPAHTMLDISNRFVQVIDQQLAGDIKTLSAEGSAFPATLTQLNGELELSALNTLDRSLKGVTPRVVDVSQATMTVLGSLRSCDGDTIHAALIALRGRLNQVRFALVGEGGVEPPHRAELSRSDDGIIFEESHLPALSEAGDDELLLLPLDLRGQVNENFIPGDDSLPDISESGETGISFIEEDDDVLTLDDRESDLSVAEGSGISFLDQDPSDMALMSEGDSSTEITFADGSDIGLLDDDSSVLELAPEDSGINLEGDNSSVLQWSHEDSGILPLPEDSSSSPAVEDVRLKADQDAEEVCLNPAQEAKAVQPPRESWFSRIMNLLG